MFLFLSEVNSQSNFTLMNPLPTGNDLTDVQYIDGVFYACGWYNALIKSTDKGETWQTISTSLNSSTIRKVCFVNKDTGYFSTGYISEGGLYKSTNGGINWVLVNASAPEISMFVSEMVGFGRGKKTTDGGLTWNSINVPGAGNIVETYFFTENHGYVVGNNNNLYRTSNGGLNWNMVYVGRVYSMYFINSQIGYASGTSGKFIKTINGGTSWITVAVSTSSYDKIKFISQNTGYGLDLNKTHKTTNGGINWSDISSDILETNFDIDSDSNLVMVGSYGAIVKSTNSGNSWNQKLIDFLNGGSINSMEFIDNQTGYFAGNKGTFYKTTDAGINWTKIETGIESNFYKMDILYDSIFYMASDTGKIYKSTNGGYYWIELNLNVNRNLVGVNFTNENEGNAISFIPKSYNTTNGGLNWTSSDIHGFGWINDVEYEDNNVYVISEEAGINYHYGRFFKSSNRGISWNQKLFISNNWFSFMDFKGDIGFLSTIYTSSRLLYKTFNAGENWQAYNITNLPSSMHFINSNVGFLIGGQIGAKTVNGGQNWETFNTGMQQISNSYFLDYNTGFVYGGVTLARTTNGGGIFTNVNLIQNQIPSSFFLHQNYPNPFNPSTRIKFDIPKGLFVKLKIYDMLGREVATLVNEKLNPGTYEYEWNGINLPSGVYFYKIEAENFIEIKRMVLVK